MVGLLSWIAVTLYHYDSYDCFLSLNNNILFNHDDTPIIRIYEGMENDDSRLSSVLPLPLAHNDVQ